MPVLSFGLNDRTRVCVCVHEREREREIEQRREGGRGRQQIRNEEGLGFVGYF